MSWPEGLGGKIESFAEIFCIFEARKYSKLFICTFIHDKFRCKIFKFVLKGKMKEVKGDNKFRRNDLK